jgi:transposase InsO family protein
VIRELIDEAVRRSARLERACEVVGISVRTLQRWALPGGGEDRREGPRRTPGNKLSEAERKKIVATANAPEHKDLSPKQIVPRLADRGVYLASESTFYRVLRAEDLLAHRERSRPPSKRPKEHVATGPNELWSWDITWLPAAPRGTFFYLYLVEDIWSRKIVGWSVETEESMEHGARLVAETARREGVSPDQLVLHSDNGGPMTGATMLATLKRLGILPSFSRPRVSDDNPFPESLFRTLKYRPEYPSRPFASIEDARAWVAGFVHWYNTQHLHSALRFVTPEDRHAGRDATILEGRREVYERARRRRPERWARGIRNWEPLGDVTLNPAARSERAALRA